MDTLIGDIVAHTNDALNEYFVNDPNMKRCKQIPEIVNIVLDGKQNG